MATKNHTIDNYFARKHLANGMRIGLDKALLLERSGMTESLLNQPLARITPEQMANLVSAIWEQSNDEFMGMVERPVRYGIFAYLAEQLVACKTLGDVYEGVVRFYNLLVEGLRFSLTKKDGRIFFSMERVSLDRDKDNLLVIFLLCVWHRFPSWLVGQVIPLLSVYLPFPEPQHSAEYRFIFPCECLFKQTNSSLIFDEQWMHLPVVQSLERLPDYLAEVPVQWFRKQDYHELLTTQVLRLLEQAAWSKDASIDSVATRLHMTSRTLRRKLRAEDSGFQHVKDSLRRDQAINFLVTSRYPIAEVGRRVGFAEPAAFTRAFKQWTGVSPNRYRQELQLQRSQPKCFHEQRGQVCL